MLTGKIKKRLIEVSYSIIDSSWKCEIIEINTDEDHVHILFEASPQTQLSKLANNYKTVTSRLLRKEFTDDLRQWYWHDVFWSDSYFICTVAKTSSKLIRRYIHSQGKKHKNSSTPITP